MKEETDKKLPLQAAKDEENGPTAATTRWMGELGVSVERLSVALRTTTEERPFVYELRLDLLPAAKRDMLLVAKGFGADGPLVAFHSGIGFLNLLRGFESQLRSGKVKWRSDQYAPANYDERAASYLKGDFYKV